MFEQWQERKQKNSNKSSHRQPTKPLQSTPKAKEQAASQREPFISRRFREKKAKQYSANEKRKEKQGEEERENVNWRD